MPTPSNNRPDPQSPRSYAFSSTCPDPDEQTPPVEQTEIPSPPRSPPSWRPHLSPPFRLPPLQSAMEDDAEASRSSTMSPQPQSTDQSGDGPEEMIITEGDTEDSQKPTDTDEEMIMGDTIVTSISNSSLPSDRRDGPGNGGEPTLGGRDTSAQDGIRISRYSRRPTTDSGSSGGRSQTHGNATSPRSSRLDKVERSSRLAAGAPPWGENIGLLGMGYECADMRMVPVAPSCLRPGSRFHGTQQSERQRYDVQVEIKNVDLRESFLCGYLRIQGLTEDHPTLTTYFEGEIIGSKYSFITRHPSWGASDRIDLSHWNKFAAFQPFAKQAKKGRHVPIKDVAQRENIFMRWKEHFLVPDHRVRTINGASFEGFYYICFNQVRGEVSGIYFHSKSEKFQQLELKHVENKGCYSAMEFR